MSKTIAAAAKEYRQRKAARFERMEAGHRSILALLADRDTPIAKSIRKLAEDALL